MVLNNMIKLVVDIEIEYMLFTMKHSSSGYCVGFCLKWLGDILNKNKPGYPKGVFFVDVNDKAELIKLMERARKKHDSYETNRQIYGSRVGNPAAQVEFFSKYNDYKQRDLEKKSGQAGLFYKYSDVINGDITGLSRYPIASLPKQGVMLTFAFNHEGVQASHAVAAVRVSEEICYFFDPNNGVYEIIDRNPEFEIGSLISRVYGSHRIQQQVVVSQSRVW